MSQGVVLKEFYWERLVSAAVLILVVNICARWWGRRIYCRLAAAK
ncbi:hypothetical protein NZJ93_04415 [Desulfofundulus thermocisternus]|nr:hypothetical protein [Desulfofundulus thermocisternus]